jgi:hypothetical protein
MLTPLEVPKLIRRAEKLSETCHLRLLHSSCCPPSMLASPAFGLLKGAQSQDQLVSRPVGFALGFREMLKAIYAVDPGG